MIPLNQEQYLGKKAYLLMVSRRMTAGLVILLITLVIMVLGSGISGFVAGLLTIGGTNGARALAQAASITNGLVLTGFILGLIVCIIGIITARLEYQNYTFTFEEFDLKLKRGIVSTKVISIPYRQIQDVNLERDILHRATGTSRVIIDSAGHEEADEKNETDIILEPIDMAAADEIRQMLQRKIGVQVVEGEKEADRQAAAAQNDSPNPQTGDKGIV